MIALYDKFNDVFVLCSIIVIATFSGCLNDCNVHFFKGVHPMIFILVTFSLPKTTCEYLYKIHRPLSLDDNIFIVLFCKSSWMLKYIRYILTKNYLLGNFGFFSVLFISFLPSSFCDFTNNCNSAKLSFYQKIEIHAFI